MDQNPNLFSFIYQLNADPMIKETIKYAIKKQLGQKIDKSAKIRMKRLFENPGFFASFNYGISRPAILKNIIISKNYAVFHVEREGGYCGYRYCNRRPGTRFYIIGVNPENNKLFLEYRRDDIGTRQLLLKATKTNPIIKINKNGDDIDVYTINDKIIQIDVFDYEIDSDLDPNPFKAIKVLTFFKPIRIIKARAQGDLILTLLLNPGERDYEKVIESRLSVQLIEIILSEITTRIVNILSDIGLNVEVERTGLIRIAGLNPNDNDTKIVKIIEWLQEYVANNLILDDIFAWLGMKPSIYKGRTLIRYEINKENPVVDIEFYHGIIREFGNTRGAITIQAHVYYWSATETKTFQKIYEKIINSVDYSEAKTEFGRHKITVNALPTRINVKINTPMGERTIQINDLPLKVVGKIVMEHPEHKTKIFTITTPTVINFETIETEEIYLERINKHILNAIYRQIKS